jgi:uncharacterized protein YecT (DUF1311 family)
MTHGMLALGLAAVVMSGAAAARDQTGTQGFDQFVIREDQIEARYSDEFRACMRRSGGVTVAMRDCAATEGNRLDAMLSKALATALKRLGNDRQRAELLEDQQAWPDIRKARCQTAMNEAGQGTASLIVGDSCFLRHTIRRTLWLETRGR